MIERHEPSSVRLRDIDVRAESVNAVLSLGFYAVCGVIGLCPRPIRHQLTNAFVSWSEAVDEQRYS
ncbi:MAG: serine/threonine protein phosphatase [Rhodococcus sp. (in: high G+C Gram-positive bacteria)]